MAPHGLRGRRPPPRGAAGVSTRRLRWTLLVACAAVFACAPPPPVRPAPAPSASSAAPSGSPSASQAPPDERRVAFTALGVAADAGRAISPSGARAIPLRAVVLRGEPGRLSAVAVVRGAPSDARFFLGVDDGLFVSEHDLLLHEDGLVVFAGDDGAVRAKVRAAWPPTVTDDGRVLLVVARGVEVRGARGERLAGVEIAGPLPSPAAVVLAPGGGLSVVPRDGGDVALVSASGASRAFPAATGVASKDGRTLAVVRGEPHHDVVFVDVATGKDLARVPLPRRLFVPPVVAFSPDGARAAVGIGPVLHAVDVAKGRVKGLPGLPSEHGTLDLHEIRITPRGDACLFGIDANMRRNTSCEARVAVDLAHGTRTSLGPRDACLAVSRDAAVRVALPAPPPTRRQVESGFFGPRGVCGLEAAPDGRRAVRLEEAKDGAVTAVILDLAAKTPPGAAVEIPLDATRDQLVAGALALSVDGTRLAIHAKGRLSIRATSDGRELLPAFEVDSPGAFLGPGLAVVGIFSGELLVDAAGRRVAPWPPGLVRCIEAGAVVPCG